MLQSLHHKSVLCSSRQICGGDFAKFCGLLRIYELYSTHLMKREIINQDPARWTIRNWDKVNTWLDQMFWQIYPKLMLSGFLSFWPHEASTASDRKGTKIQHKFSWFCHFFFKTWRASDIGPQIVEFKNLEVLSSYFPGLRNLSSLIDLSVVCTLTGLSASRAQFSSKTSWSWWSDHHWHHNNYR